MTPDARQTLQNVIDFCNAGWTKADKDLAASTEQPALFHDGQKAAFNSVFHFASELIDRASESDRSPS